MNITYLLPFSYINILNKFLNNNYSTYLDLGCGDGSLMNDLDIKNKKIVGVDIDKESCDKALVRGIYDKVYCASVLEKINDFELKSFDVIFSSQVLEHLDKTDALGLINKIEKIATKRVILTTIVGYFDYDPVEERDDANNPYQKHLSGWSVEEFKKMGYKVYGKGSKFVYTNSFLRKNKLLLYFGFIFSYLLSIYYFYNPTKAMYLIAVKDL